MPTELPTAKEVWEEAKDLTEELADAGGDESKVAHAVADFLDAIIPLDKILPGDLGEIAEEADGPVFEEIVEALLKLFKVDPEKRDERRAKRKKRQAKRKEKREERKANREAKRAESKDEEEK
tara:strand:- start:100 stop:468 length:369 start_codon:yes stop_codon:yes gene_type:complete